MIPHYCSMRQLLILGFIASGLCFFTGCQENKDAKKSSFSGKIINPHENTIKLLQNGNPFDSISLTENGKFHYEFPEGSHGIFTFKHQPESQIFYLEEGDSLLMRLNTMQFDETLTFTGEGAAKNNFLIDQFLKNEANNNLVYSYFRKAPRSFIHAIDSIRSQRRDNLEKTHKKNPFPKAFKKIADKLINYEYYSLKERYFFLIRKYAKSQLEVLPENFTTYREKVDCNITQLTATYIYQRFLDNYLKNLSIDHCVQNKSPRPCYRLSNFGNTLRRLKLSDSLFKDDYLRRRYLGHFGKLAVMRSSAPAEMKKTTQLFSQIDYPEDTFSELKKLIAIQKLFLKGQDFSGLAVHNTTQEKLELSKVLDKRPTALYFWDLYAPKSQNLAHEKISRLQQQFPGIQFIGVNINSGQFAMWKTSLRNFGYGKFNEVQLQKNPYKTELFRNFSKKLLLLSADEHQVINTSQIFSKEVVSALEKLDSKS